jgi:hypothetical protein
MKSKTFILVLEICCAGGESRRVCPKCHQSSHWNARDCGNCGYTFGSDERKNDERIREDERRRIREMDNLLRNL